jgi:hypothetical protein
MVCQDRANTKGAYRFSSNERVSEEEILAGHFQSTRERALVQSDPVVVLHDTTEFTFKREDIDSVGRLNKGAADKNHLGRTNYYTSCGILMHSSLAVTTEGLPLVGGDQILDTTKVQRNQRAQEKNQPDPGTY